MPVLQTLFSLCFFRKKGSKPVSYFGKVVNILQLVENPLSLQKQYYQLRHFYSAGEVPFLHGKWQLRYR